MAKYVSLVGQKFTYLTPIEVIGRTGNGTVVYRCSCKCGNETTANANSLRTKVIKSCGCLKKEWIDSKPFKTHGLSGTRIYKIWQGMLERCYKPNSTSYCRYGAIGIKVCDRWHTFELFYEDMKDGYADHLTIERKKSNQNYCKENCKWATYQEQNENRKSITFLTIDGETKRTMDWGKISGVSARIIRQRFNRYKWSAKEAVFGKKQKT